MTLRKQNPVKALLGHVVILQRAPLILGQKNEEKQKVKLLKEVSWPEGGMEL